MFEIPWLGLLENNTWLKRSIHEDRMCKIFAGKITGNTGVQIVFPRQANSIFFKMSEPVISAVHQQGWQFYTFIGTDNARLMCPWDTSEESINQLVSDIKAAIVDNV